MRIDQTARGAWQVSAPVTNGRDTWVEFRTYYGIDEKHAVASFYSVVWAMGWKTVL